MATISAMPGREIKTDGASVFGEGDRLGWAFFGRSSGNTVGRLR
jgi:hypothetical protein